jgi:hypothetical protein
MTTTHNADLLQVLLLVLCYRQAACSEMFSEEELICTAVPLDEEVKKNHGKGNGYLPVHCKEKKKGNILLCVKNLWKILSGFINILECQNLCF